LSREEKLKRFFKHSKDPNEWEEEYAKVICIVERQGIIVDEDYPHLKLMNQIKQFQELRKEEFELIGKMLGCVK